MKKINLELSIGLIVFLLLLIFAIAASAVPPFGTNNSFSGALKPTAIEQAEHNNAMGTKNITEVPSNLKRRYAYDANNNPQYIGTAPKGSATNASGWMIQKMTYTATYLYQIDIAYGAWDSRASLSYE